MSDEQDRAEDVDEEMTGLDDPVTSDEVEVEYPPDRLQGVPYADADVTDESFAERTAQEEPEVWEAQAPQTDRGGAADEQLEQIIDPADGGER